MLKLSYPLSREVLEAARQKLKDNGVAFDGDAGEFEARGIKGTFSYDGEALTVIITKKPWLATEGLIRNKFEEWLKG